MPVNLSQKEISDLKKQGYSDEEISKAVTELEKEELSEVDESGGTTQNTKTSSFSSGKMDDIARYQL